MIYITLLKLTSYVENFVGSVLSDVWEEKEEYSGWVSFIVGPWTNGDAFKYVVGWIETCAMYKPEASFAYRNMRAFDARLMRYERQRCLLCAACCEIYIAVNRFIRLFELISTS